MRLPTPSRPFTAAAVIAVLAIVGPMHADSALESRANEVLRLRDSDIVSLDLPATVDELTSVTVSIAGTLRTIDLHPHSVRADDYALYETLPGGGLRVVESGPPCTLRGAVRGAPGSRVAAAMFGGGFWATIQMEGGPYWIEPIEGRVDGAAAGQHAVYRAADAVDPGNFCDNEAFAHADAALPEGGGDPEALSGSECTARLACEADYLYYLLWGTGAPARIQWVVNAVNLQFEPQVGISHEVSAIIVNAIPDPYPPSGTVSAIDLLCYFSVYWTLYRNDVPRDAVQLFTARTLLGTRAGYATVGTICQPTGCFSIPCTCVAEGGIGGAFSVALSDVAGDVFAVALSAHQLAHNWGAVHCDIYGCCPGGTLCSTPGVSGVFSDVTRYSILLFKSSLTCLDCEVPACPRSPVTQTVLADDRAAGDRAGRSVANAGDVDDDGCDDYIVGAPYSDEQRGRVDVYSGADGSVLHTIHGENPGDRFGWSVSGAGHVNSDDHDDFIVGAPYWSNQRGRVFVFSGANGNVLRSKNGKSGKRDRAGYSVSGGVDIDNDGRDDFIIGEPKNDDEATNAGRARVFSGRDGSTLKTLRGERKQDHFGWTVLALGKANADAYRDFIIAAPKNDDVASNAGKVYVYSGKNFNVLYALGGKDAGNQFGRSLAAAGEIDFDGRDDFIVGSPYDDTSQGNRVGRVDVYSGRNGAKLWSKTGQAAGDQYGWSVGASVDVDGDTLNDVVIGAPKHDGFGTNSGRVYIRSGWNGCNIASLDGFEGDQLGYGVAMLGGGCGNEPSALAGAPGHDDGGAGAGRVTQIFFADAAAATTTATPSLDLDGDGAVGFPDLVQLLGAWGTCEPCPEDLTRDGRVDADDVVVLMSTW